MADRELNDRRVYLDWNASAPLRPQAREAARRRMDAGREPVLGPWRGPRGPALGRGGAREGRRAVGADPRNVDLHLRRYRGQCAGADAGLSKCSGSSAAAMRLLVSAIEHASVRAGGRFAAGAVEELPVRPRWRGRSRCARRRNAGQRQGSARSSPLWPRTMRTASIQPVRRRRKSCIGRRPAACRCRAGGGPHAARYQWPRRRSADALARTRSAAPKGAGALIKRDERLHFRRSADPRRRAGARPPRRHRERRRRSRRSAPRGGRRGEILRPKAPTWRRCATGWKRACAPLTPDAIIFGAEAERLPNTTLVAMPGTKAETLVIALRSRWRCGVLRLGLLLRQGRALACARRHGGSGGTRARRDPRQHRRRPPPRPTSTGSSSLEKAREIPI